MDLDLQKLIALAPDASFVKLRVFDEEENTSEEARNRGKMPQGKWGDRDTKGQAIIDWVDRKGRVGWTVPNGFVVVDVDNKDHPEADVYIEKILKAQNIIYSFNRTKRGTHFIFKDSTQQIKTTSKVLCALGISCDYRSQGNGYICLPTNDPNRSWGKIEEKLSEIPSWLLPIGKLQNPTNFTVPIGMKDGDGRNEWVFKWTSFLLTSNKLTRAEINESLRLINNHCFATAMDEKELFTAGRMDGRASKEVKKKTRADEFNEIADKILEEKKFITYGDQFYLFNGVYHEKIDKLEVLRWVYEKDPNILDTGRNEIHKILLMRTQVSQQAFDSKWNEIATGNGVLDLVHKELHEPNSAVINTIRVPYRYDPNVAFSPLIDEFMNHISCDKKGVFDPNKKKFLYEIAGYCLLKSNLFRKFFLFVGQGSTGKSTYGDLLTRMVGEENVAQTPLEYFDDNYHLASAADKLINKDDDVAVFASLKNTGKLKSIVSGQSISVRQICCPVKIITPYCTCLFFCNKIPRINDNTTGLFDRMVIVEMEHRIKKPDRLFSHKITDVDMEYFMFKAVEAISNALAVGRLTVDTSNEELLSKFKCRQSSLNEFVYENNISRNDLNDKSVREIYLQYTSWCEFNGYKNPFALGLFREEMRELFKAELTAGQITKFYFPRPKDMDDFQYKLYMEEKAF